MQFVGEHLLPGQIGHFFVLLAFVASIISTIAYFTAGRKNDLAEKRSWLNFARLAFITQLISAVIIFITIFYICANHYFEYMYAYKHASKELESKYLLACIWEGQEGSFLLWTIWHSVLGIFIMVRSKEWEAPVMTVIGLAQCFLLMMLLGLYVSDIRLGSSPFTLTRNEIAGPIFSKANYLSFITNGIGLNVLLRNYWMVIHPPILFLGFASTIIPFAFAYAGIQTKRFGDWVTPALPWTLFSACVLGVGIMMGGRWAYESLSFGGYWAWDPVENASLVPWLILIAGLHTMVIYKATAHSLKASYLFAFLTFIFILYSTFLTRTGILGDTSVHAFTDAGMAINVMILLFVASFTLPSVILLIVNLKKMPSIQKEESTNSREFWMFIGSLVFFLAAMFIIAKTSVPVYNKIFGTSIAQPENVEFSYNKVIILVAIIIGLLSAVTQYFKYKKTEPGYIVKKIAIPTVVAAIITALLAIFYPLTYYKMGAGFLGAAYVALFAAIYSVMANAAYIWTGLNGKLKAAGGSIAHLGFALMLAGILISSANKKVISDNRVTGLFLRFAEDPKQKEDPMENLTLVRNEATRLGDYTVTYNRTSANIEKDKTSYHLDFEKRSNDSTANEKFTLMPEVYLDKKEGMKASNPATKTYLTKDVFTYISYVPAPDTKDDTAQFKIYEMKVGDTGFYNKGFFILNKVGTIKAPTSLSLQKIDAELSADLTFISNDDSMRHKAFPRLKIDSLGFDHIDDTIYAKGIYVQFIGIADEHKIKIAVKNTNQMTDFITLKAYIFPYINLVWLGLVIMALGIIMSAVKRAKLFVFYAALALIFAGVGLFYMFLLAN
jgi:cytochrome c-type biogenesis protein CcmF